MTKQPSEISWLQQEIADLEKKLANTNDTLKAIEEGKAKTELRLEASKRKLEALLANPTIRVSDHAVIRYMERNMNLDLDLIRQQMVTDELRRQVAVLGGAGKFPLGNGRLVL